MRTLKSVKQRYLPSANVTKLMEDFRQMTNDCIRTGLEFEGRSDSGTKTPSMRRLSLLSYGQLKGYGGYSGYRLCAISKAAGILSSRRKSIRRGFQTRKPYVRKLMLTSCYGFRIENGRLFIHLDAKTFESVPLNSHSIKILSDKRLKVRSFTLTETSLSLCISKECADAKECADRITSTIGIDRNLRNLAVGNDERITYYDMSEIVKIAGNTRSILRSFRRTDVRLTSEIATKYGRRKRERVGQILHRVSKDVVASARANQQAIVFEEITGIRKLYRKGNGQARAYRSKMNSWPFHEIKRQIEYKAAWEGVPVITLSAKETKGTTMDCPRCGERLQVPVRGDNLHYRQLWCDACRRWWERDTCAVLNISRRGWVRFAHSKREEQGEASEAVKGNAEHEGEPLILRVDASKPGIRPNQTRT
ncbi:MAG: transposase [Thaumarchaeota archaeon]|nr:transposase [Nitrososphaerota archaeon]